jgi:hypothetical protein
MLFEGMCICWSGRVAVAPAAAAVAAVMLLA